jgi:mannobiose 2-epimerase
MTLSNYKSEVAEEFFHIIAYWEKYSIDHENGGFWGTIMNDNIPKATEKSAVATARILWSFSNAIRFVNETPALHSYKSKVPEWTKLCDRAMNYLIDHFWDKKYLGVYWNVDAKGHPSVKKKQLYAHSFFVYGMSEYYRATGNKKALLYAKKCFDVIAQKGYDVKNGGYIEAFAQDWNETDDYILSKGEDRKSMNTHLHLLECFANLYRIDKSEKIRFHLHHCLEIMLDHVIGEGNTRMTLFFTQDWKPTTNVISYGHDIEASWLVLESAEILGDEHLIKKCKSVCIKMASDTVEGLRANGGMVYEKEPDSGHIKDHYSWWVIAESMVGYYNAYQLSGKAHYLEKSEAAWEFTKKYLIDHENGEWFGDIDKNFNVMGSSKGNPWKAPYHNSRACMEIYNRIG